MCFVDPYVICPLSTRGHYGVVLNFVVLKIDDILSRTKVTEQFRFDIASRDGIIFCIGPLTFSVDGTNHFYINKISNDQRYR